MKISKNVFYINSADIASLKCCSHLLKTDSVALIASRETLHPFVVIAKRFNIWYSLSLLDMRTYSVSFFSVYLGNVWLHIYRDGVFLSVVLLYSFLLVLCFLLRNCLFLSWCFNTVLASNKMSRIKYELNNAFIFYFIYASLKRISEVTNVFP
jgi:hypothetical protein